MFESIRNVYRLVPRLLLTHTVVYAIASVSIVWSRDRMLAALDFDPELMDDMMQLARKVTDDEEASIATGLMTTIRKAFSRKRDEKKGDEDDDEKNFGSIIKRDVERTTPDTESRIQKRWPW